MAGYLEKAWYQNGGLSRLLLPLSWLFCLLVYIRRKLYAFGLFKTQHLPVPVIVVGNITVGGTGKTPLVLWLVEYLRQLGYTPGIVSRGYGGKARSWPQQVRADSDPVVVGDEALLLARRCGCALAVGPDRVAAAQALLQYSDCNIIVADDGLQHYRLGRDIEMLVIDGVRRFGNGYCLPAGPLRETPGRMKTVDFVISNGLAGKHEYAMKLKGDSAKKILDESCSRKLSEFSGAMVHAVAGIGNPERFFAYLRKHGLHTINHPFPDHHVYKGDELDFGDEYSILMTEKDAVKCARLATDRHWYVPVYAELDDRIRDRLSSMLGDIQEVLDQENDPGYHPPIANHQSKV